MRKKYITILVAFVMLFTIIPVQAMASVEHTMPAAKVVSGDVIKGKWLEKFDWSISSDGILTVIGKGEIPDTDRGGYEVPWGKYANKITGVVIGNEITRIGRWCFSDLKNTTGTLIVPESVKYICSYAFNDVGFNKIIMKGVTSIESQAFCYSDINTLSFPKSLKVLNADALDGLNNLKTILVDPNNAHFSAIDNILFSKDKTVLVKYPAKKSGWSYTVPGTVKEIREGAFQSNDNLIEVILPKGLVTIGSTAFCWNRNLEKIIIRTE